MRQVIATPPLMRLCSRSFPHGQVGLERYRRNNPRFACHPSGVRNPARGPAYLLCRDAMHCDIGNLICTVSSGPCHAHQFIDRFTSGP